MLNRACVGIALAVLAVGLSPNRAYAQVGELRISQPANLRAIGGSYTITWEDDDKTRLFAGNGLESITWYYSSQPNGADRVRMASFFHEDFSGPALFARWAAQGGLNLDWLVKKDRRRYLSGNRNAAPIALKQPIDRDVVVSVLVRPTGIQNQFGLGLRWQPNGKGYEIRNVNNSLEVGEAGLPPVIQERLLQVIPRNWYWYEIGMRTKGQPGRSVDVRVRVFDEDRKKLLLDAGFQDRPKDNSLLRPGVLALWGPADFAEIYVDPWNARWIDAAQNEFRWDTSAVPDGDYFLVAEVQDGRNKPRLVVSEFQVQVRNQAQAAAD
jgi:hypothetical protein